MPTQKRETGKNYIGLLSDETEEPRTAEVQPAITPAAVESSPLSRHELRRHRADQREAAANLHACQDVGQGARQLQPP